MTFAFYEYSLIFGNLPVLFCTKKNVFKCYAKRLIVWLQKIFIPHHRGMLTRDPHLPRSSTDMIKKTHPLRKVSFLGKKMLMNSKHKYSGCALLRNVTIYCQSNISINICSI